MEKNETKNAIDIECLFEGETYWGQDGNLYSSEEGEDGVLAYVTENEVDGEITYTYTIVNEDMLIFPVKK